ncbi:MAG: tetratricopeptide repeat protein [Chitinophagaceae bacterium]|nr:MAG: tetratricopeptide repeat protein [Chitinophagaceae bacterium]
MKAMPLFKLRKYETGMACLDRAVRYDSTWLPYRAFIKTIFSKQYRAALADLELCRARNGAGYVMDHSYDVYRALCHLQLEEFDKALLLLAAQDAADAAKNRVHHFRVFYLGIAYLELHQYEKALVAFDRALAAYPQFSDAYFYKGKCLGFLGRTEAGLAAMRAGKAFYEKGYTINEDNVVYETYPYQVTWRWKAVK